VDIVYRSMARVVHEVCAIALYFHLHFQLAISICIHLHFLKQDWFPRDFKFGDVLHDALQKLQDSAGYKKIQAEEDEAQLVIKKATEEMDRQREREVKTADACCILM
jgi:hypothetical protein